MRYLVPIREEPKTEFEKAKRLSEGWREGKELRWRCGWCHLINRNKSYVWNSDRDDFKPEPGSCQCVRCKLTTYVFFGGDSL